MVLNVFHFVCGSELRLHCSAFAHIYVTLPLLSFLTNHPDIKFCYGRPLDLWTQCQNILFTYPEIWFYNMDENELHGARGVAFKITRMQPEV